MTRTVGAAVGIIFIVLFFAVVAYERASAAAATPRASQVTNP